MNRHCSGYTIACPKMGEDETPCEANVWVTLDGEQEDTWVSEYVPQGCTHEWDDLTPGEQDAATESAIWWARERLSDRWDAEAARYYHESGGL